ncbi:MAG: DivIVA domain-containing protein [Bacteroidia bacterium]|nr:DivIVA domain-containing protein [Bacteroidia bacterium]MDW8015003.1 DivIVA domain-containing protein [Bacteroidia bacterium]
MLTPIDIQNQTFNRSLRGYDPEEVRAFLRQVAQIWGALLEEKHALKQKVEQLSAELARYKEMESLLQRTLLQAEEASRLTLQNAEKNAALLLQEAQHKADEIISEAHRQKAHLEEAIQVLRQRRQDILLELKAFLSLQLERLEQLERNTPILSDALTAKTPPPSTPTWAAKIAEKL